MIALFQWLDAHPHFYALPAGLATIGISIGLAIELRDDRSDCTWRCRWLTSFLLLTALLAWRWPAFLDPHPLNPDEAHLVTGAITLAHRPALWTWIDSATSGPANSLALLPTHWLGFPLDYFNARLAGLLMVWGALAACHALSVRAYGRRIAALGLLPALLFFCTVTDGDFIHYSSEHFPLLIATLSLWCLWSHRLMNPATRRPDPWRWSLAGLLMGLLPWTKLQAAPLAAALALCGTWLAFSDSNISLRFRWRRFALLTVTALTPSLIVLGTIAANGQWWHFINAYVVNNLAYTDVAIPLSATLENLIRLSVPTWSFPAFLLGTAPALLAGIAATAAAPRKPRPLFWWGGFLTLVAIISILWARRGFQHYLLFLPLPLTIWTTASLGEAQFLLSHSGWRRLATALFIGIATITLLGARLRLPLPDMSGRFAESWRQPRNEIGDVLRHLATPGDTLAVWGWDCHLHVETGLPQATRAAITEREIKPSPQRDTYYRPRYLADLQDTRPVFFVDAVGFAAFGFDDRATQAHETFPALSEFLERDYVLLADFRPDRLYLRRDRAANAGAILSAYRYAAARRPPSALLPDPPVEAGVIPGLPGRTVDGLAVSMMLPPESFSWTLDGAEDFCLFDYGYDPRAYERPDQGNGTELDVTVVEPDGTQLPVGHRFVDPAHVPADRGRHTLRLPLPVHHAGAHLIVSTTPGPYNDNAWDWLFVARLRFHRTPLYLYPAGSAPW